MDSSPLIELCLSFKTLLESQYHYYYYCKRRRRWKLTNLKMTFYNNNSIFVTFLCLILISNNYCLVSFVNSYPMYSTTTTKVTSTLSSFIESASTSSETESPAATFTSSQTECDWKGRGGSSGSIINSNRPTILMTTDRKGGTSQSPNNGDNMTTKRNTSLPSSDSTFSSSSGQLLQTNGNNNNNVAKLVQTINLRCSSGQIQWEDPKGGGLKITIAPSIKRPYNLCLENSSTMKNVRFLLEVNPSLPEEEMEGNTIEEEDSIRLLPILTHTNSKCYQIHGRSNEPLSTTIYIETHTSTNNNVNSQSEEDKQELSQNSNNEIDIAEPASSQSQQNTISLAYEVEAIKGDGDPCRPCSESEVLSTYCTADSVAKGSIVQIRPASDNFPTYGSGSSSTSFNSFNPDDNYDSIYIKSDFVIHQTQPIFTKYSKLSNFLTEDNFKTNPTKIYNTNKPQRVSRNLKDSLYGGIIHHPSKCSISIGSGEEFLWLIKFRFGKAMTDCVIYWDDWKKILMRKQADCPVFIE